MRGRGGEGEGGCSTVGECASPKCFDKNSSHFRRTSLGKVSVHGDVELGREKRVFKRVRQKVTTNRRLLLFQEVEYVIVFVRDGTG